MGRPPVQIQTPILIHTMTKRAQFLRAARGKRQHAPAFVLQAFDRRDGSDDINLGYTCSKKVGNAVARNRAKRRLREAARAVFPHHAPPGWDFVLIGRAGVTADQAMPQLQADMITALQNAGPKP